MDDESRKSIQEAARQFASLQGEPEEPNDIVSGVVTDVAADGYVWVSVAGSTAPVPCVPEVACIKGDKVSVLMDRGAGRCYVVGNQSSPSPSGADLADVDAVAQRAQQDASAAQEAAATAQGAAATAQEAAEDAQDAADEAHGIANAAQYSLAEVENVVGTLNWIAEHGTYSLTQDSAIVDGKPYYTRSGTSPNYIYTVVAEPVASELSTYYELHLDESVQNFLASHIWLDQYGLNIAVSNTNAYRIHQGTVDGTKTVGMYVIDAGGNIVADFTASGAQIGNQSGVWTEITSGTFDIREGSSTVMAHFGYGSGNAQSGTANAPYFTLGSRKTTTTTYSSSSTYEIGDHVLRNNVEYVCISDIETAENWNSAHWEVAIGNLSTAENYQSTASGWASHAENNSTAIGSYSHAEGVGSIAIGTGSHSEGSLCRAIGMDSHAEGGSTESVGIKSHAEGSVTVAGGYAAHAEGGGTEATGDYAHAQNYRTVAASENQTALGKWNVIDSANAYAVIVGNGSAVNARSNALTVDWDGDVVADGTIRSNGIISVRDSSIDRDAATIAEDDWATSYFRCQDKDGDVIAVLRNAQRTTGRMDTFLYVYNDDTTGEGYTDNYIRISVARDGTRTYAVGDPSAFRNALGINTWGFATGASDTTLSNSETKVPFTSITTSGCTLSSGGIKVNAAGNYEISGSYEFRTGFNANDVCHIIVKNGTTVIAHALWRTYSANPYYTMTLPPFVASLSANDTIYMYVYNQGGARGIGRATASQGNGLYVKRLN